MRAPEGGAEEAAGEAVEEGGVDGGGAFDGARDVPEGAEEVEERILAPATKSDSLTWGWGGVRGAQEVEERVLAPATVDRNKGEAEGRLFVERCMVLSDE